MHICTWNTVSGVDCGNFLKFYGFSKGLSWNFNEIFVRFELGFTVEIWLGWRREDFWVFLLRTSNFSLFWLNFLRKIALAPSFIVQFWKKRIFSRLFIFSVTFCLIRAQQRQNLRTFSSVDLLCSFPKFSCAFSH